MLVLEGGRRTLSKMRPALFVEIDDDALRKFGSSAEVLVTHLQDAGYEMHELIKSGPPRLLPRDRLLAQLTSGSYLDVLFIATGEPKNTRHCDDGRAVSTLHLPAPR